MQTMSSARRKSPCGILARLSRLSVSLPLFCLRDGVGNFHQLKSAKPDRYYSGAAQELLRK